MIVGLAACLLPGALGQKPRVAVDGNDASTVSEGIKLVQSVCQDATVNMHADKADYVMTVSDDGSGAGRKGRRAVVANRNGDVLAAVSTRSLKNAVKDACAAIIKDWMQSPHGAAPQQ